MMGSRRRSKIEDPNSKLIRRIVANHYILSIKKVVLAKLIIEKKKKIFLFFMIVLIDRRIRYMWNSINILRNSFSKVKWNK